MSEEERAFYRIAQERGESLARATDLIDDLAAERDALKTALKGFTDVLAGYGIVDTDGLLDALHEWSESLPDGRTVWVIVTDKDDPAFKDDEPFDPAHCRIVSTEYDRYIMGYGIGEWVFSTEAGARAALSDMIVKHVGAPS